MLGALWDVGVEFLRDSPIRYWLSCFVVGAGLELWRRAEPNQLWSAYLFTVRYALIYAFFLFLIGPTLNNLTAMVVQRLGGGFVSLNFPGRDSILGQITAFGIYFFLVDFFYYWFHRAQHRIPWLWDQHSLHHSPSAVNVTTAIYHHWTEGPLQSLLTVLPFLVLFKLDLSSLGIISGIIGFWQFFLHANWRLPLGVFTPVIAGPQWHRIHHSRLPEHTDKNFSAHFPIWDVIFGTYWAPHRQEYPPTGIDTGEEAKSVGEAALWPFARWWRRWQAFRSKSLVPGE